MPRQEFEEYYSEDELDKLVILLNAFTSEYSPWKLTKARIQHEDIFGETIQIDDHYYRIPHGASFVDAIKLSRLSMERLCFVLFESTDRLKPIAEQINRRKQDAFTAQLQRIFPNFTPPKTVD